MRRHYGTATPMSRRGWVVTGTVVAVVFACVWALGRMGAFRSAEDLNRRAEALDAGIPEGWPFDGVDAAVPDARATEAPGDGRSFGSIEIEDTFLTVGFTGKPVRFHIHHAKAVVRRGPDDDASSQARGTSGRPRREAPRGRRLPR